MFKKITITFGFCVLSLVTVPARATVLYVDSNATGTETGVRWDDAHRSLAFAIAHATSGDQIWVAAGTYARVTLKSGVAIIGGFSGTESAASASDPAKNITYISGGGTSRAITSDGNNAATTVRGFHIVEGRTRFPGMGGGLLLENSSATFVRCSFSRNVSGGSGGAAAILGGSPSFVNCRFFGNESRGAGGAVFVRHEASPTFVNCLFHHNTAKEAGAISVLTGSPTLINCTIADNRATVGKAGALFDTLGESSLRNCIVWNNTCPVSVTNDIFNHPQVGRITAVSHSSIQGGWSGDGNLPAGSNPRFVDALSGDYRLKADSPCLNVGLQSLLPNDVTDLGGNGNVSERIPSDLAMRSRIEGTGVDIGAFEWHP